MKYVICNLSEAKAYGIEIIPTMRQSVDKTKVILHEEMIKAVDAFDALMRYDYDDAEFLSILNSEEWTAEEGTEQPNEDYGKVLAMQILNEEMKNEINTYTLSNSEALSVKEFYPMWSADGIQVKVGERYRCDDLLWEVVQAHTTQENWKPSIHTASLWKVVDEEHEGTQEDPIPYNPPMEIFKDKYYTQNEVLYKCTRNSEIPLSHDLSALVGIYVELV